VLDHPMAGDSGLVIWFLCAAPSFLRFYVVYSMHRGVYALTVQRFRFNSLRQSESDRDFIQKVRAHKRSSRSSSFFEGILEPLPYGFACYRSRTGSSERGCDIPA
jgi:hypothetical protein